MCVRCIVRGRVQGVGFRFSTREAARRLGVRGSVRNLADGSVEVVACAPPPVLEAFLGWLRAGPPAARVDALECAPAPSGEPRGFVIA